MKNPPNLPPKPPAKTSFGGPNAKRYLVYAAAPASSGFTHGPYAGVIEGCLSLRDAAKQAAVLIFFRQDIRQVAVIVGAEKGIFLATGKVPWQRHPRGRQEEVRFVIELEREERKKA